MANRRSSSNAAQESSYFELSVLMSPLPGHTSSKSSYQESKTPKVVLRGDNVSRLTVLRGSDPRALAAEAGQDLRWLVVNQKASHTVIEAVETSKPGHVTVYLPDDAEVEIEGWHLVDLDSELQVRNGKISVGKDQTVRVGEDFSGPTEIELAAGATVATSDGSEYSYASHSNKPGVVRGKTASQLAASVAGWLDIRKGSALGH